MSTWIIQGNPKRFDVDAYLSRQSDINWAVGQSRLHRRIQVGDTVFVWRSDGWVKGSGGIVAHGAVTSAPQPMNDDAPDLWRDGQKTRLQIRIELHISDVRLTVEDGMVQRGLLERHPLLGDLTILRWRNATLYEVKDAHELALDELWASLGKNR